MARFALVTLCVTAALTGAKAASPLEFGMEMGNRAYGAVCWYENLKAFPETHSKNYGMCSTAVDNIPKEITNPSAQNKKYFEFYPEKKETWYGERVPNMLGRLPAEYKSSCEQYLKDPKADPPADESDAVNDGGNDYPYKAYTYCMMKTLRDKHGDDAIQAVKDERTHSLKHWMTTLLDRENEFRKRHGAEQLTLSKDLNTAAQEWADKNAKECNMYHSKNTDSFRQWRNAGTGESLSAGGGGDASADQAYMAADGWYEENKDYPFPGGYKGNNADALFMKIGHFTQSVWKGTKYVGYGYAYNEKCSPYTRYIAARYSPAGNMMGAYPSNVDPAQ